MAKKKWKGLIGYAKGAKKTVSDEKIYFGKKVKPGAKEAARRARGGYLKARHGAINARNAVGKKGKR